MDLLVRAAVAWCHGASGIALARTARLGDSEERAVCEEIEIAVASTLRESVGQNNSLCHGDLGNLEIVALAADRLNKPDWRRRANEMLAQAVEGGRRHGWLSGMPTGVEAPGFMTGLAGIGYALLRAGFPAEIPSVLLLDGGPRSRTSGS
ncbi:MAG TPA: lanthionine synthetase LanC family protein [Mycobacteriales bacterium]